MDWRWPVWDLMYRVRGEPTIALFEQLQRSQYDAAQAQRLATERLGTLLAHALGSCPAYRSLGPQSSLNDFPVLSKALLREQFDALTARDFNGRVWSQYSGGSTGEPTRILADSSLHAWRTASGWRGDCFGGLRPTDRFFFLWGHPTDLQQAAILRGRLHDWLLNRYMADVFTLSSQRVREIHALMQRLRPRAVVGYASALLTYARLAAEQGLEPVPLQKVIPTAETCLPEQAAEIGAYFKAPVMQRYGARETGDIAHQCEQGRWHVHCEHVRLEVRADDGRISDSGAGDLLVTCLSNFALPLIRYEIGDRVDLSPAECSCGRVLPTFSSIQGRSADVIRQPDGSVLNSLIFNHVLKDFPVRQFRVVQDSPSHLRILLVPSAELAANTLSEITVQLRSGIAASMHIDLEVVTELAPLPSGKLRQFVGLQK
jgi:phenylacetate-CoA ligase